MKFLALFPHRLYTRKMSPCRRHQLAAVARKLGVEFALSGQGWPEWADGDTATTNIRRIMPGCEVVWWYKPLGAPKDGVLPLLSPECVADDCLTVEAFNEAWWPGRLAAKHVAQANTRLVVCHHWGDVYRFSVGFGRRVVYIPHCAEPAVFAVAARPWAERDIDVLLTGTISREVYPLRSKWLDVVSSGAVKGKCHVHPHPGCRLTGLSACDEEVERYAELLGRSKLALVCSSVHHYGLAKYVEAAMAGALAVGDTPNSTPHWRAVWARLHYHIFAEDPPEKLAEIVNRLLATLPAEQLAGDAATTARAYLTMDQYAGRLLWCITACLAGMEPVACPPLG